MSTHQEKFEDIEKKTNEVVADYVQARIAVLGAGLGNLMTFSLNLITAQTRELTLLREFEEIMREGTTEVSETQLATLEIRADQILLQLKLFREKLAEENAKAS